MDGIDISCIERHSPFIYLSGQTGFRKETCLAFSFTD
jgi:hypothetical protein